jgi:hypothetical protein
VSPFAGHFTFSMSGSIDGLLGRIAVGEVVRERQLPDACFDGLSRLLVDRSREK